jgi:phosphoribosyl 1,2-cyclic phosphodiesterase
VAWSAELRYVPPRVAEDSAISASPIEAHLDELRPKRLVLTHMSDDMLNHPDRAAFETAEDGKVITIGP